MTRKIIALFAVQVLLFGAVLPESRASDGDVDYSAPYITVDPETGELITVNPGPRPEMHDMAVMSAADSGEESPQRSSTVDSATTSSMWSGSVIVALATAIGVAVGAIIFVALKAKQNRSRAGLTSN